MLSNKKILIGITGSIAAYKIPELVRLLVKQNATVKVVMTTSATQFVTPLTLATVSKHETLINYTNAQGTSWYNHVELASWADVLLIAPCSANTLSKMANGACDNLLLATYLSAKCPVMFAPAMDLDMYIHPNTVANVNKLQSFGNVLIPAESGELASGLIGQGRMAEPEHIVQFLQNHFATNNTSVLNNKIIIVTAGPTYEAIDPVRFIGNYSSGKMGFALAESLANSGAKVHLITGPTSLSALHPNITTIKIISSDDMFEAANKLYPTCDIAICAAAVADYKPATVATHKIKKETSDVTSIPLVQTHDTLKWMGQNKKANQLLVGFALETDNEEANAIKKIERKNLDFIILNSLQNPGAGFKHDTNKITIITKHNKVLNFELKNKQQVANDIVQHLETYFM
jgi:phosphopantothenoylcysteine decarboxylase / phosphopantothenate---cysteine ligase